MNERKTEIRGQESVGLLHSEGALRAEIGGLSEAITGDGSGHALPPVSNEERVAPAVFVGNQDNGEGGFIALYKLTRRVGCHPENSAVSAQTLLRAGFSLPSEQLASKHARNQMCKEVDALAKRDTNPCRRNWYAALTVVAFGLWMFVGAMAAKSFDCGADTPVCPSRPAGFGAADKSVCATLKNN